MGISQFPAAAVAAGGATVFATELPAMGTTYENEAALPVGIYQVSVVPTTTNVQVVFATEDTIITTQTTTSGVVQFALSTAATRCFITGAIGGTVNAVVAIEKTAEPLTVDDIGNGTLDTISTTSTYNQTGLLGVLVFSGGAGGGIGNVGNYNATGGGGGRAGFINGGVVYTNIPTTVTIGAAGIGPNVNVAGTSPNASSFGNLVEANAASNIFTNGNGAPGARYGSANGNASGLFPSFNGNSTTGGGGGGQNVNSGNGNSGAGSGIGTGGNTGGAGGNDATGFAAGGGGGMAALNNNENKRQAGDGSPGVVYVMRGF